MQSVSSTVHDGIGCICHIPVYVLARFYNITRVWWFENPITAQFTGNLCRMPCNSSPLSTVLSSWEVDPGWLHWELQSTTYLQDMNHRIWFLQECDMRLLRNLMHVFSVWIVLDLLLRGISESKDDIWAGFRAGFARLSGQVWYVDNNILQQLPFVPMIIEEQHG